MVHEMKLSNDHSLLTVFRTPTCRCTGRAQAAQTRVLTTRGFTTELRFALQAEEGCFVADMELGSASIAVIAAEVNDCALHS
jgi:hypothetical protein